MSRSDDVAREFLEASRANMTEAIHRMAAAILAARDRAEDCLPNKGMDARSLALLWRDIHPNHQPPPVEMSGDAGSTS